jgi:hypothetical protein
MQPLVQRYTTEQSQDPNKYRIIIFNLLSDWTELYKHVADIVLPHDEQNSVLNYSGPKQFGN